ncbi:phage portal protein [Rhizobium leucaenae]|uniref:phage portal protein n=1 Tax=Rhizobium leucaenae TaxID=29450 RepID=UPI0003FA6CC7|nr:phage portal protein [Rhizobium leucaenae]
MWPFDKKTETRASLENPSVPLSDVGAWRSMFETWNAASGVPVTVETALGVPAVWCAVNFLAGTLASLPLELFVKNEAGREAAEANPLYAILQDAPNPEWTSFAWRKYSMVNILTLGRAFTFIERNKAGRVTNLWPLNPLLVTVERRGGRKFYIYDEGARKIEYAASEIIDVPFMLEPDGLCHVAPIQRLAKAVGLAIALESYAEKLFLNGGVPPLALYGPVGSPAAASRAASDVTKAIRDANAERRNVLIMPAGHELKPVGIDPDKSQMIDARRYQIEEVARIFNLPPAFLQDLTHGTFSNVEQQDLNFTKHTLMQWLVAWEQELNLKLFTARNTKNFVSFNQDSLLRGDFVARMTGYATAVQNAILKPDEIRGLENWPAEGGEADKLYIQGATVPLGMQNMSATKPADAKPANDNNKTDEANAA